MMVSKYYRTIDLANAIGMSVQQVRNYEVDGLIPPVERSVSGYRQYERRHLMAIQAAAHLIAGFGRVRARECMRAVYDGNGAEALAAIDAGYAQLDRTRMQLQQTLAALNILTEQLPPKSALRMTRLRVGEAAKLAGVRISALRFWEQQGLLEPGREKHSRYRLYDEKQLRRLRIVALLRRANHDFPTIRTTLAELEAGKPERALAAVERRRHEVAAQSWQCMRATALLYGYIMEFEPGLRHSVEASCISFNIRLE